MSTRVTKHIPNKSTANLRDTTSGLKPPFSTRTFSRNSLFTTYYRDNRTERGEETACLSATHFTCVWMYDLFSCLCLTSGWQYFKPGAILIKPTLKALSLLSCSKGLNISDTLPACLNSQRILSSSLIKNVNLGKVAGFCETLWCLSALFF